MASTVASTSSSSDSSVVLCALVSGPRAEAARRSLDRQGLLDTQRRAFSHDGAVALPLKDCRTRPESSSISDDSGETLRTALLPAPQRRGAPPSLKSILEHSLAHAPAHEDAAAAAAVHELLRLVREDAAGCLPKRWEKLGDCVLFAPRGIFDEATPAAAALGDLTDACRETLFAALAASLGARRLGVQGSIEISLHRKSTVRLLWPLDCEDGWVEQRENGILYGLDVTKNMFSSGNVTEKARVSSLDCRGEVIVDLYAGIGYFTLPYLVHAKVKHLHACEWDEDALNALRRNLTANAVDDRCTLHPGDNATAPASIAAASGVEGGRVANRVNLGLIPSSEAGWGVAMAVLRPEGGMLHVHANVGAAKSSEAAFCEYLTRRLAQLTAEAGRPPWDVLAVEHLERVKSYAPQINHVVVDLWRSAGASEWVVGRREDAGSAHGSLRLTSTRTSTSSLDLLDESAIWECFSSGSGTWEPAPDVRCLAGAELQAKYAAASTRLALVGSTPATLQRDCLGLFERVAEPQGGDVHGYPCYALVGSGDGGDRLWHAGSCWMVGNRADLGSSTGGLLACDGALSPEGVRPHRWQVMGLRNDWVAAPGVKCIGGAALEFELQSAAMTIALVGATPRELHRGFVGVFEKVAQRINGYPTYKLKGKDQSVLLWHAAACWIVGNFGGAKGTREMLRVYDGALRPECVAATWEVFDPKRRAWVEAAELKCLPKHKICRAVEEVEARAVAGREERVRRLRRTTSAIGRLQNHARRPGGLGL